MNFKKIISFSLWGNNPKYTIGAVKNAKLAQIVYPGWVCRFYIGQSTIKKSEKIIKLLSDMENVEIIKMQEEGDWTGMFWRFLPASEKNVSIMISRDTDSRLNKKEAAAVKEFEASEKKFHIMRDHPYHKTEILGGMWGVKAGVITNIEEKINNYKKGNFWQVDQNFLKEIIFPIIKNECLEHDDFFSKQPYPYYPKDDKYFIGQAFEANDKMSNLEHLIIYKNAKNKYLKNN